MVSTIFLHSIIITVFNRKGLSWTPRHITVEQERVLRSFFSVSVKYRFGVGSIIHFLLITCMFWLIKTIGKKKQTIKRAKDPDFDPELSFYWRPIFLCPCFIICTVEAILWSWYTCISKQDSEAIEISFQVSA